MNASIRPSLALAFFALLSLAGCASAERDAWNPPRTYREQLVVGEPPLRSGQESPSVLSVSHERERVRAHESFTTGHQAH